MLFYLQQSDWARDAKALIAEFQKTENVRYKHPSWKRVGGKCMTPMVCMPCFLWSFIMRIVACPFMCACKGPGFMCSDNGCTMLTDKCFGASWTAYDEVYKLPKMPGDVTKDELSEIVSTIEKMDYVQRYRICEMVFGNTVDNPTPTNVKTLVSQ